MLTLGAGTNGAGVLTAMVSLPAQKYSGRGPNGRPSPTERGAARRICFLIKATAAAIGFRSGE
jgi:hypothetical protein